MWQDPEQWLAGSSPAFSSVRLEGQSLLKIQMTQITSPWTSMSVSVGSVLLETVRSPPLPPFPHMSLRTLPDSTGNALGNQLHFTQQLADFSPALTFACLSFRMVFFLSWCSVLLSVAHLLSLGLSLTCQTT